MEGNAEEKKCLLIGISGRSGSGKCLDPDTEILMFNGTKKKAKHVKVGDLLMGDNSIARKVLSTSSGISQMYDIIPFKDEKFRVNEHHVLSLFVSGQFSIYKNDKCNTFVVVFFDGKTRVIKTFPGKKQARDFAKKMIKIYPRLIDIDIQTYLNLNRKSRQMLKSYWTKVIYPEKDLPICAYILGLWLNKKAQDDSSIRNDESEKLRLWYTNANLNFNEPPVYSTTEKLSREKILYIFLKKFNLIKKKYIPLQYKANSIDNRLKLLAGLIDSNGYCHANYYQIEQKNRKLSEDIVDVCRSLGFSTTITRFQKAYTLNFSETKKGVYNRIKISGQDIERIPVLCKRKKECSISTKLNKKTWTTTGFNVEECGSGYYCGFELDGNGRFLLGTHMVTHNSTISKHIKEKVESEGLKIHVFSMDDFYRELSDNEHKLALDGDFDFDCIESFDIDLFKKQIRNMKNKKKFVHQFYDHALHKHKKEIIGILSCDVCIVEGLYLFADDEIAEMFDLCLFIEIDSDESLIRRIKRDMCSRGYTLDYILKQYQKFVKPAYSKLVEPSKSKIDVFIQRGASNQPAIETIFDFIISKFKKY